MNPTLEFKHIVQDFLPFYSKKEQIGTGDLLELQFRTKVKSSILRGICIATKGKNLNRSVTLLTIQGKNTVVCTYPIYSPAVEKILVLKKNTPHRAKYWNLVNISQKEIKKRTKRDTR